MFEPKPANHYDSHDGYGARPGNPGEYTSDQILNATLYTALAATFCNVRITNPGMPSTVRPVRKWVGGRPRSETQLSAGGEHYVVCCPFCGDTRWRLSIHHLWGTPDPTSRRPMWFLANCFNEGCLRNTTNQQALAERVFPNGGSAALVPLSASTLTAARAVSTLAEVTLPESFARLDEEGCPQHVRDYVASKGFDVRELAAQWGVGYSPGSRTPAPGFDDRLVVPCWTVRTTDSGRRNREVYCCGWQARRLDDSVEPKYLTSAGMPRSRFLYGFDGVDRVKAGPVVLVEGVADVWRLGTHAVGLLGKTLSEQQKRLLSRLSGVPLVVFLDADAQTEAAQIRDSLRQYRASIGDSGSVTIATPRKGRKDPGECTHDEAWDQIAKALQWSRAKLQKRLASDSLPLKPRGELTKAAIADSPALDSHLAAEKSKTSASIEDEGQTSDSTAGECNGFSEAKSRVRSLVAEIQRTGILIDLPRLKADIAGRQQTIRRLQSAIDQCAGHHVPARNLEQIAKLLHDELGIPVHDRRADGTPRIDVPALNALGKAHPIASQIAQLITETHRLTAASELSRFVVKSTGLVHPVLNPEGAVTGRFTCRSPSLLSLPKCLRPVVIAHPGHNLLSADYKQFELRVLAMLSRDKRLCEVFLRKVDPHTATASALFQVPEGFVSDEQRAIGKKVNFAIIYGQTPYGLSQVVDSTALQARAWIDDFFAEYSDAHRWIRRTRTEARRTGVVMTAFGRRRPLPDAQSDDAGRAEKALRQAVNTTVQGTAADVFRIVLCRLAHFLPQSARILMPIHDGVLIEFADGDEKRVRQLVKKAMGMLLPGEVPLEIDIAVGKTWGDV